LFTTINDVTFRQDVIIIEVLQNVCVTNCNFHSNILHGNVIV